MPLSAIDEQHMRRALTLASYGLGQVKTNPLVGAVIAIGKEVIAQGFHERYGAPHAERMAFAHLSESDKRNLSQATIYVTLEPCNHYGKTPPCTDAILQSGINRVVLCQTDPNPQMSGNSVALLQSHGLEVHCGVLEKEGQHLNRAFYTNQINHRPYIILKWAQSADRYMGKKDSQVWLSNDRTNILTHRWRSEVDAIVVGSGTVITDNPSLTTRHYPGRSPQRVVLDRRARLSNGYKLLNDGLSTWIYSHHKPHQIEAVQWLLINSDHDEMKWIFEDLYARNIGTLMIEGGQKILKHLIDIDLWDEARVIHTSQELGKGLRAPKLVGHLANSYKLEDNLVRVVYKEF